MWLSLRSWGIRLWLEWQRFYQQHHLLEKLKQLPEEGCLGSKLVFSVPGMLIPILPLMNLQMFSSPTWDLNQTVQARVLGSRPLHHHSRHRPTVRPNKWFTNNNLLNFLTAICSDLLMNVNTNFFDIHHSLKLVTFLQSQNSTKKICFVEKLPKSTNSLAAVWFLFNH